MDKYLELGDVGKAALASGFYNPKKARGSRIDACKAGSRVMKRIGPAVELLMDQEGLSMAMLLRKLTEGLDASTAIAIQTIDEGGTPQRDEKGKFIREISTVPDHKHRTRYLEMALKMRKAFPSMPAVVNVKAGEGGGIPVSLEIQHQESLKGKTVDELKEMLDEAIQGRKKGRLRVVGKGG